MSDKFEPISCKHLLKIILHELQNKKSVFGIPQELFFKPHSHSYLKTQEFGQPLDTPIGVAAGPHTQMAQNIVVSWLMGARYIELKTIQTLDELEIAKPCIDMQDEGYNCEWSQELKIHESYHEYLNAWIIIHILQHKLGFSGKTGTIFNMSVGYNMQGILKPNVQWFFDKMSDCSIELKEKINEITDLYPKIVEIDIPTRLSDNITLSTMHGCPADEIEEIAKYLLQNKKLHTFVKLNPTLLGPEILRYILNNKLNFKTIVPDVAFEHDLKYTDALQIIRSLQKIAQKEKLQFGLKLTNTLESINHKTVFDSDVEMMYMSGRSLHPISIHLAHKLQQDLKGEIPFSFSAGIDAFNVSDALACGFQTITVCSDLLKPGGYMRLHQYFEELTSSFDNHQANNITQFIQNSASEEHLTKSYLKNLSQYADEVLNKKSFKREYLIEPDIKTSRKLNYFDCIAAPCVDTCATHQDIPNYLYHSAIGDFDKAYETILNTNPFPSITGMVCDHLCQNKCTRVHYDSTVLIREVKRFVSEQEEVSLPPKEKNGLKVGIIGAGPSGLSCAYYLALAGFEVVVFEAHDKAGGMIQYAIPGFRLTDEAIDRDFKRVTDLGVSIHYNYKIEKSDFEQMQKDFHYVYVGAGAQLATAWNIENNTVKGIMDPLDFLFKVRKGEKTELGKNVLIIGGGNTAMDVARTSFRMVGESGKVTVVYRRTIHEMPADEIEIKAILEEGVTLMELVSPEKIISANGKVESLICSKMELKGLDNSGRPKPVKIPNSEFEILCDTIVPALGQNLDIDFVSNELLQSDTTSYQTLIPNVYVGGDTLRNASTAINAIGDGRKAANKIIEQTKLDYQIPNTPNNKNLSKKDLVIKRANRIPAQEVKETPLNNRRNFNLVSKTLDKKSIMEESDRCLYCDELCNICTTVCPNFANYSFDIEPVKYPLQKAILNNKGLIDIMPDQLFEVDQPYQILNIPNFCNECGNCDTFCPTNSAPYKKKPELYLTLSSYENSDKGYFLEDKNGLETLHFKQLGLQYTLTENENSYFYDSSEVIAELDKSNFQILQVQFKTNVNKEIDFRIAAEMSIILKGARQIL